MTRYDIHINGARRQVDAESDSPLLYVLRDQLGLNGPKFGCGLGQCGACTVHIDGTAVRSCSLPVSALGDRKVTTLEGLGSSAKPSALQQAFIDEQAAQCGYCSAGMIMQAQALLERNPRPTDAEVRAALDGNLCRCGAHNRIVRAVLRAAKGA